MTATPEPAAGFDIGDVSIGFLIGVSENRDCVQVWAAMRLCLGLASNELLISTRRWSRAQGSGFESCK